MIHLTDSDTPPPDGVEATPFNIVQFAIRFIEALQTTDKMPALRTNFPKQVVYASALTLLEVVKEEDIPKEKRPEMLQQALAIWDDMEKADALHKKARQQARRTDRKQKGGK